jgi:hypothetical protein
MFVDCNSSKAESTQSAGYSKKLTTRTDVPSLSSDTNRRKAVSFVDGFHSVVTLLVPFYELTKEERRTIWWTKKDFKIFRQHAQLLASHDRQLRCQFQDPYTPPPCEYQRMKHFVETNCPTEEAAESLLSNFRVELIAQELRCSAVPELRGLEQWTSRSYSDTKKALSEEHRKTVLRANRNAVADKSVEKSRVCRLLARFWGEVDAEVMREDSSEVHESSLPMRPKSPTTITASPSKARPIKLPLQHRGIA